MRNYLSGLLKIRVIDDDDGIVATFEGVSFTEADFKERTVFEGQVLKRHRNGGGWVPAEQRDKQDIMRIMPYVAESAYVGPHARVTGASQIYGTPWITDNAWISEQAAVSGGTISGNAQVRGNSKIVGNPEISGNSQILHFALIAGSSKIMDNAKIGGWSYVKDDAIIGGEIDLSSGDYLVTGSAVVMGPDDMQHVRRHMLL